jgi:hypothetical protein
MNRTRIFKNGLLIVVVFAVLIGVVVVTQETAQKSSAASSDVLRQPRPHPKSHIKIADLVPAIESGSLTLYPRPHPKRLFLKGRISLENDQIHPNLPDRSEV